MECNRMLKKKRKNGIGSGINHKSFICSENKKIEKIIFLYSQYIKVLHLDNSYSSLLFWHNWSNITSLNSFHAKLKK